MREVIARHVDLCRSRVALRVHDDAVEDLGHTRRIPDFFLVAHHVLEQGHLFHFLETALPDRPVGRLRRDQQQRRMVPVGGLHRRHEIGDTGAVLGNHHRHLAGSARVAVGHHTAGTFMGAVPERDAGLGEKVRDRHEGRTDDPEGMGDAMHLKDFDEGFFGGHFHRVGSWAKDG